LRSNQLRGGSTVDDGADETKEEGIMAYVMRITCAASAHHPMKWDARNQWYKHYGYTSATCTERRIVDGAGNVRSKPKEK
jgi:hypothetical protein